MGTIERSVEVGRSAADVWTVLEDVRRIPTYSPSTVAVSDAPERLSAVGQRFRQTVVVLGRHFESDWTVTDLQPGRRVALEGTVGVGARYCLVEEVEPRGPGRSRLTVRITFTMPPGLLGRVADALGAQRRAQREAEEVLANLKAHLEGGPLSGEADDGLPVLPERRREVERLLRALASWAAGTTDVRAVGIVGSWARNQPRLDSDLDVVVLADDPAAYLETEAWVVGAVGETGLPVRSRQWGVVTERRVRLSSGLEVEFGFADISWAATDPCDAGTLEVVRNGLVPLFDPSNLLKDLAHAATGSREGRSAGAARDS